MTINSLPTRSEYTATAAQTVFNYKFKIFASTDLNVYQTLSGNVADDAADIITAYTVAGVGLEDGGSITLTTPASAGDLITIVSDIPESRTTDYQNNGDFLPNTVNDDFDRVVSLSKQTNDLAARTLTLQQAQQSATSLTLPAPSAGEYVKWNAGETGLENTGAPAIIIPENTYGVVADMVAATTLSVGDVIQTLGYIIKGDGGDNLYEVVAAGTGVNDGGSYIDLNTLQAEGLFPGGVYNVKQFGVAADGSTDDAAALTAAIAADAGSYVLPSGVIKIDSMVEFDNNCNVVGQGPITSSSAVGQGTLIWSTVVSGPGVKITTGDSYFGHFDIVAEDDCLELEEAHRNVLEKINCRKGTKNNGFVIDGSFENRFIACTASTNGASPHTYTTGFNAAFGGAAIYFDQDVGANGSNATDLFGFIGSGCEYGILKEDASTFFNVYGGTLEGNNYNVLINGNDSANHGINIYGTHIETPGTANVKITNSARVNFYGADMFRDVTAGESLIMENAEFCTFVNTKIGRVNIDSDCRDNIFRGCTFKRTFLLDGGMNTVFTDIIFDSTDDNNNSPGNVDSVGVQSVVDGNFEYWMNNNQTVDAQASRAGLDIMDDETTIVKYGSTSAKLTSSGNSNSGVKFGDIGDKLLSEYMTISCWIYVPTGNTGNYGLYVAGLDATEIDVLGASNLVTGRGGFDSWIKQQWTVYIGEQGSTRRGAGPLNVVIVVGGGQVEVGYVDGVVISDGRNQATRYIPKTEDLGQLRGQYEETGGAAIFRSTMATVSVTAAAIITANVNVPSGAKIIGAQIRVNEALAGGETWDADWDDGAGLQSIATNQAVAVNTKVNKFHDDNANTPLTDAETDILITKNAGGAFTPQGEFSVIAYYHWMVSMDNN